jgi:glyoxylase-like metal-dependent hydrolase (beta-lactamase superfamily II)
MDVVDLRPDLRMLLGVPGQAYLLRRPSGVLLVDTGLVGGPDAALEALRGWGLDRDALTHVLLTHWHPDHTGGAAEIGAWPGVQVWAHHADAPVVRGEAEGPAAVVTDAEAALFAQVTAAGPAVPPPARVDRELSEEVLDELGLEVIATPGHTDGSIALLGAEAGVLFTGDIAAEADGAVVLGPFNVDRARAAESFRRVGERAGDVDTVCFGHGRPLRGAETAALRDAARAPAVPDPFA